MTDTPDIKALGFNWKGLDRIEGDVARLEEDKVKTNRRLSELQIELKQAESADREAFAAALLEGKDEPKKSTAEKVEDERAALEKRGEALDAALRKLTRDRAALVRQNRTGWQRDIREQLPAAASSLREAAATVQAETQRLNALVSLLAWTEAPDERYRNINPVGVVKFYGKDVGITPVLAGVLEGVSAVEQAASAPLDNLKKSA
jgi:chromosome segregation ATPase